MSWLLALAVGCGEPDGKETAEDLLSAVADAGPDRDALVGETLTLDGAASQGVAFAWDFGDGATAEGASAAHAYEAPGTYAAVLTVTGEDGGTRADTAVITVTAPATGVAPVWSRTMTLAAGRLWAVNPEADTIGVIDLQSTTLTEIPTCAEPRTVSSTAGALADDQVVGVACEAGAELRLYDAATLAEIEVVPLPEASRPYGVAGRGGVWWVTLQGTGQVARWDGDELSTFAVGPDPRGVALDAAGRVLVTRWRSAEDGAQVYALEDGVVSVITLGLDAAGDSDTTTGGVPNLLEEVVPSPDGATLYVPALHANILRGTYRSGAALDHQTSLRAILAFIDAAAGAESPADRKQFDERGRATAVAPSPAGDRLFVLHSDTGHVTVLDAASHQIVGTVLNAGLFPTGLLVDGDTLYVHAWLDRQVRAYDVADLSTSPAPLWAAPTLEVEPLSDEILLGKRIFHNAADTRMTKSGYVCCANCHPDGRDDGLTWDFTDRGEGLRNTTSLEGRAGVGMGPLHWSGNFDEVQDFENDIRGPFAGTGFLAEEDWAATSDTLGAAKAGRSADLDALAAYVASLDAGPPSPWAAPTEGEAAFLAAGCAECHPAPLYTDSAAGVRHDVGTLTAASGGRLGGPLDGLDTPTLLGAWATAPYLHDGSAATLEEAIAAHATAAGLDAATISSIADFIRGL